MEEIERLREQLREEQRRREEEQRLREAAEERALKEQGQREAAEERADASRPSTLEQYLETCHSLSLAVEIITDPAQATQGETTNPTNRVYPRRIIPWAAFAVEQEKVWDKLSFSPSFSSQTAFPSRHQLDYVRSLLRPVSSEIGLRHVERDLVENAVQKLVDAVSNDASLKSHLGLNGTVSFESHTNFSVTHDPLSEPMEQESTGSRPSSRLTPPRRKARGKGNRADQFCIYQTSDNQMTPVVAIEYKPPHKLTRDEITTGLVSEIQPDRDVIDREGEGYEFQSRRLITAVVTQLFSYMIGKSIQYGYVCTNEVYIFLYIPDDSSCVHYSICVPGLDVQDDDETRLHRTAVAQVFAFILQAMRSPPPSQTWHDTADHLETWKMEMDDILQRIPETDRKPRYETPYKPQKRKRTTRSPIRTRSRSRCLPPQDRAQQPRGDDSGDDDNESPSPMPKPGASHQGSSTTKSTVVGSSRMQEHGGSAASQEGTKRPNIRDRSYCTHECLRGLAFGGLMDEECPNSAAHGNKHLNRLEFLRLARDQLAVDRGRDADCMPLYLSGSRGALFKFRLSSHGYTLVAKGVEIMDTQQLHHESKIYSHLQGLQGEFVPVCLGIIDLIKPYYYDCGVYKNFMFLSYGGRSLNRLGEVSEDAANDILATLGRVHQHGVLHRDAEPRNILYDERTGKYMMVDLMLSEFYARPPLGSIKVNDRNQKRKSVSGKQEKDVFAIEVQSLRASLRRCRGV